MHAKAKKPRYFVILGAMRTGSNLLERTLSALPGVFCYGEVFNYNFIGEPECDTLEGWSKQKRDDAPLLFLEHLITIRPYHLTGFRLFKDHAPAIFAHVLHDPQCARIILRRDMIESYTSRKIAQKTGQWLLDNQMLRQRRRVVFDPDEFTQYKAELDTYYDHLVCEIQRAGLDAHEITYPQLGVPEDMRRLIQFLGLPVPKNLPRADTIRQNPEPLLDKIANPKTLIDYVGETDARRLGWIPAPHATAAQTPLARPFAMVQLALSRVTGVAYAPVPGAGVEIVMALMNMIDCDHRGKPPTKQPGIEKRPEKLFDLIPLHTQFHDRLAFSLVCHPVWRAYNAYLLSVFSNRLRVDAIYQTLVEQFGPLPGWHDLARITAHDLDRHREIFVAWLKMARQAQSGLGQMHGFWRMQTDYLAAFRSRLPGLALFRMETFSQLADHLAQSAAVSALAPGKIRALQMRTSAKRFPCEQVVTPEIEAEIAAIWSPDMTGLNYAGFAPECYPQYKAATQ